MSQKKKNSVPNPVNKDSPDVLTYKTSTSTYRRNILLLTQQGCGSGSEMDPDSIGSVDPDPHLESGSGSRRAKITDKNIKKLRNFMFQVLDVLF